MKVILSNLEFFAYHGLYDFEKKEGAKFIVDVELEEPVRASYLSLEDVINYEEVFAIIETQMSNRKDFIEEVARLILHDLRLKFPMTSSAMVKVTKCNPPIKGMNGAAAVVCSF